MPCRAASLNSNDVFVLFTKSSVYIWAGKGSTGDEREMAKIVAKHSPRYGYRSTLRSVSPSMFVINIILF